MVWIVENFSDFDDANSIFWNELCGTHLAKSIGVTDSSIESLNKYDSWYFDFYPYLLPWIDKSLSDRGGKLLEIGLGFGTTSRYLMKKNEYVGLDIAAGPVDMVNLSAKQLEIANATGIQGSALSLPFGNAEFDSVVAIGSLHHTGNLDKAIEEVFRVLKPGGHFIGMVYNIFSLRNLIRSPLGTFRLLFSHDKARLVAGQKLRWMSDHDSSGVAAPTTEYLSKSALKQCLSEFSNVAIDKKNLDETPFLPLRKHLINTKLASKFGLDLYFSCTK